MHLTPLISYQVKLFLKLLFDRMLFICYSFCFPIITVAGKLTHFNVVKLFGAYIVTKYVSLVK